MQKRWHGGFLLLFWLGRGFAECDPMELKRLFCAIIMGQEVVQVLFTKDSVKNAFYMTFLYKKIRKGQQK